MYATEDLVRVHPDGGITTIARSGNSSQQWYKLEGGRKVEVSAPKKPDARYKDDFVQTGKKVDLDEKTFANALISRGVSKNDADDIYLRLYYAQDKLGSPGKTGALLERLFKIIPNKRFQNPENILAEVKKCVDDNGNVINQGAFEKFSKEIDDALNILNKNKDNIAHLPKKRSIRLPGAKDNVYYLGVAPQGTILYHYTNEVGFNGITSSEELFPSLTTNIPNHAHFGDGYYMSNFPKNTKKLNELSNAFVLNSSEGHRFKYCVAIDVSGLEIYQGSGRRFQVFLIRGSENLDLTNRLKPNLSGLNNKQ